jgi:hypothetical protein
MLVSADEDDHPMPPIYIPIEPPLSIWGPNDPRPSPPIYIPVPPPGSPPGFWGGVPPEWIDNTLPGDQPGIDNTLPGAQPGVDNELPPWVMPPIYVPVPPPDNDAHPEHPIYWPVYPEHPIVLPPGLSDEQKEALKAFVFGNLPPFQPPDYVAPV